MESINNTQNYLVKVAILLLFGLSLVLTFYSQWDISISALFFDQKSGFLYKDNLLVKAAYHLLPIITKGFILACVIYLICLLFKPTRANHVLCSGICFLLVVTIIVPGFIVNTLMKDNFGRARPREIVEFNGNKSFSKAFVVANQCHKNCSFVSGHAAMAFNFSAIAYIIARRYFCKVYIAGILLGCIVGASRIIMGGHFASDVIASGFVVLISNHIIFLLWNKSCKSVILP